MNQPMLGMYGCCDLLKTAVDSNHSVWVNGLAKDRCCCVLSIAGDALRRPVHVCRQRVRTPHAERRGAPAGTWAAGC